MCKVNMRHIIEALISQARISLVIHGTSTNIIFITLVKLLNMISYTFVITELIIGLFFAPLLLQSL